MVSDSLGNAALLLCWWPALLLASLWISAPWTDVSSPYRIVGGHHTLAPLSLLWKGEGRSQVTYLIGDVLADKLIDSHKGLGPVLICVPGTDLHRDSAAASHLLDIVQATRKTRMAVSVSIMANICRPYAEGALCTLPWALTNLTP